MNNVPAVKEGDSIYDLSHKLHFHIKVQPCMMLLEELVQVAQVTEFHNNINGILLILYIKNCHDVIVSLQTLVFQVMEF